MACIDVGAAHCVFRRHMAARAEKTALPHNPTPAPTASALRTERTGLSKPLTSARPRSEQRNGYGTQSACQASAARTPCANWAR